MERDEQRKGVPIIALSAHVMVEQRDACFLAGMNDYLSKPIVVNDLINMINAYSEES